MGGIWEGEKGINKENMQEVRCLVSFVVHCSGRAGLGGDLVVSAGRPDRVIYS